MKQAAKILFLIGAIFGIVGALSFLLGAIPFYVYSSPGMRDAIIQGLKDGTIRTSMVGDYEQIAPVIQRMFLGAGIAFTVAGVFSIPTVVLCFLGRKFSSPGISIAAIIIGVVTGNIFAILAGIFSLIPDPNENE